MQLELVNNQVVEVKQNQWTRLTDENGAVRKVFPLVDGTVLVYAKIREKKNQFILTVHRGADGRKINKNHNRKVKFDNLDQLKTILAHLYGVSEKEKEDNENSNN